MPNRERRTAKRVSTVLTAVVKGRESTTDFWKETTDIVTVSKLGASFEIEREIPIGRIISIIANMPSHLRCYDEDKKLYRVWGLVQHCSPVESTGHFHIGVAFIGKHAPRSYIQSPLRTYRVVGMDGDGFWHVGETKEPFVKREHHRFPNVVPCKLYTETHSETHLNADLDAVTENISAGGVSVFSLLEVQAGDAVRFVSEDPMYESVGVVRNRQKREGDRFTVHVEFMEATFPIRSLLGSEPEVEEDVQPEVEDTLTSNLEVETAAEEKSFGIMESSPIPDKLTQADRRSDTVLPEVEIPEEIADLDGLNSLPEPGEFISENAADTQSTVSEADDDNDGANINADSEEE